MKPQKIKLIIIDDNTAFREAARIFLQNEYDYEILGDASCAEEMFKLDKLFLADIALMDIQMPGIDGISAAIELTWQNPKIKVIAITMFSERAYMKQLIESGFRGCVFKTDFYNEIDQAIKKVMEGNLYYPEKIKVEEDE